MIFEKFMEIDAQKLQMVRLKIYMICGYPTEAEEDYWEFIELMREIDKAISCDIIVNLYNTPFSPEPLTPMGWERATTEVNYRSKFKRMIDNGAILGEHLRVYIALAISSPAALFERLVINRGDKTHTQLVRWLVLNPKYNRISSAQKLHWLSRNLPDFNHFVQEYEIGKGIAWDYLQSYYGWNALCRDAAKYRLRRIAMAETDRKWQDILKK
jgi:hypothetical protein